MTRGCWQSQCHLPPAQLPHQRESSPFPVASAKVLGPSIPHGQWPGLTYMPQCPLGLGVHGTLHLRLEPGLDSIRAAEVGRAGSLMKMGTGLAKAPAPSVHLSAWQPVRSQRGGGAWAGPAAPVLALRGNGPDPKASGCPVADMGGEATAVPSLSCVLRLSFTPWPRLAHSFVRSLTHPGLRWLLREAGRPRLSASSVSTLVVHMSFSVFAVWGRAWPAVRLR